MTNEKDTGYSVYNSGGHTSVHLSKAIRMYTTRLDPGVNYCLWVIIMYQFRFIDYNKCITPVWTSDLRKAIYSWGAECIHSVFVF